MLFDRFVARLWPHSGKITHEKSFQNKHEKASKKDSSLFQLSNNLSTAKELDAALEEIEKAIQAKSATNKQLLLKAEILIRKGKFRKSRELLTGISKDKKDREAAKDAEHLLMISPQLQQERSNKRLSKLIKDLHEIAEKYKTELKSLPSSNKLPLGLDITLSIRKEGTAARSAELPCLSLKLINRTLQDNQESEWLLHDKALSLNMMGQRHAAQQILRKLKKTTRKKALIKSINKNIEDFQKNRKHYQSKVNFYLAKEIKTFYAKNKFDASFLPNDKDIKPHSNIKFLAFRKARAILAENPIGCLQLVDAILEFFPGDLAALLLRGEALSAVNKKDDAILIWKDLTRSHDNNIAKKAANLISQYFSNKAEQINTDSSAEKALLFYIEQHLNLGVAPTINKDIQKILQQLGTSDVNSSDPEMKHHHLQLLFNTQLLECLEARFRKQGLLSATLPAQKPGLISKTAPKEG